MPTRPLLVLAVVTALLGAPSPAFGASNNLAALPPDPASGTTSTTFVLAAAFDGRFDATAVTAQIAGRTLGMSLVRGTPANGTWSVATTLPTGTWQATFTAAVSQGNAPSATGAPVVVAAPAPATPPPPVTPATPAAPASVPAGPEAPAQKGAAGDAGTAQPPAGPLIAPPPPAPAGAPGPAAPSGGDGAGGGGGGGGGNGGAATPAPLDSDSGAVDEPREATAAEPRASATLRPAGAPRSTAGSSASPHGPLSAPAEAPTPAPSAAGRAAVEPGGAAATMLIAGLVGIAAVALLGSMLLVAGRRRRRDAPATVTPGARRGLRPAAAEAVTATLRARSVRRARTRLDEDPIVAALGIDDEASARRARDRAARASREGPGSPRSR